MAAQERVVGVVAAVAREHQPPAREVAEILDATQRGRGEEERRGGQAAAVVFEYEVPERVFVVDAFGGRVLVGDSARVSIVRVFGVGLFPAAVETVTSVSKSCPPATAKASCGRLSKK